MPRQTLSSLRENRPAACRPHGLPVDTDCPNGTRATGLPGGGAGRSPRSPLHPPRHFPGSFCGGKHRGPFQTPKGGHTLAGQAQTVTIEHGASRGETLSPVPPGFLLNDGTVMGLGWGDNNSLPPSHSPGILAEVRKESLLRKSQVEVSSRRYGLRKQFIAKAGPLEGGGGRGRGRERRTEGGRERARARGSSGKGMGLLHGQSRGVGGLHPRAFIRRPREIPAEWPPPSRGAPHALHSLAGTRGS